MRHTHLPSSSSFFCRRPRTHPRPPPPPRRKPLHVVGRRYQSGAAPLSVCNPSPGPSARAPPPPQQSPDTAARAQACWPKLLQPPPAGMQPTPPAAARQLPAPAMGASARGAPGSTGSGTLMAGSGPPGPWHSCSRMGTASTCAQEQGGHNVWLFETHYAPVRPTMPSVRRPAQSVCVVVCGGGGGRACNGSATAMGASSTLTARIWVPVPAPSPTPHTPAGSAALAPPAAAWSRR